MGQIEAEVGGRASVEELESGRPYMYNLIADTIYCNEMRKCYRQRPSEIVGSPSQRAERFAEHSVGSNS